MRPLFRFSASKTLLALSTGTAGSASRRVEHQFEPGLPWFVRSRGDVRLYLSEHTGDATPNTLVQLYVRNVDDIATEFGVAIDEEGLAGRECHLTDPDGNRLHVATPRS